MPTSYIAMTSPESFNTLSGTLNFEVFTSRGSETLRVTPSGISQPQKQYGGSIVLPNGSKYDPYQIYDAPVTPGIVTVTLVLKPFSSDAATTQDLIEGFYASEISGYIGVRGTLHGVSHNFSMSATARMVAARIQYNQYPWRRRLDSSDVPGVQTATIDLDFDMLINWTLTAL